MRTVSILAFIAALSYLNYTAAAGETVQIPKEEWERMKAGWERMEGKVKELEAFKAATPPPMSTTTMVDTAMDSKFGPGAPVTTKVGKLQIGGLLQAWYFAIQKDSRGFFDPIPVTNIFPDGNSTLDNNGFRIRRAELQFGMELTENISTFVMIDPAQEADGFPQFPSNQGNDKKFTQATPELLLMNQLPVGPFANQINAAQSGAFMAGAPRLLQDAYINWHGCIPHHDIQIGQFRPFIGEEGIRNNAELDFVERSMVGFQADNRDLGVSIHGSFWNCDACDRNGRFQYWAGAYDGAGTYFEPGNQLNRPDSNDHKDFSLRVLVRPLWDDCLGKLELGASGMGGRHGQGHNESPLGASSFFSLNRPVNWAVRYNGWADYKFGNVLNGLWVRGEYTYIKDREAPGTVLDYINRPPLNNFFQDQGQAFSKQGVYGALGYNFAQSTICGLPCWLKPIELLGRYDQFQNIEVANLARGEQTDRFYTRVVTAGVNYYVHGNNCKVQANYNWVDLPAEKSTPGVREFHNVRNDSFVINFQVAF